MLLATLLSTIAVILVPALAVQIPLNPQSQRWQNEHHPAIPIGGEKLQVDARTAEWNLHERPHPNATDHLIFETVYSLLQHWPNTRMRNGHSIVPGIVPKGTVLYHGRGDEELPRGPEWLSTDPEHAYLFCRNNVFDRSQQAGWQLTLVTTRPLKIVYFDGSSAVKIYGSMDAQDLFLWGKIGDVFEGERNRIRDLCEWGKNVGVDGFVRMEMDFEVMLCDFTSGVSVVSFVNLASRWVVPSGNSISESFEAMHAGSWHNHFPGETRVQLDLAGLVSFYDTQLAPSLVAIRAGQERWDHRVQNASSEDLSAVKSRLEANLIRPDGASSGIDWKTLVQVIVDRYAQRLELTRYLLDSLATDEDEILDLAKKAQTQLRIMLTPYILFSATPSNRSDKTELDWTIPTFKLCAMTHTYAMESQFESMTDSEILLLQAVRGTSREICRIVTKMWAAGVYAGIDPSLNTKESPDIIEVAQLRHDWAKDLEHLMGWLDWNVWIKCRPKCGPEEICYLPTWPVGFPWLGPAPPPAEPDKSRSGKLSMFTERLADEVWNSIKPEPDEWIRPQPRCIRRIGPYEY